MCRQEQRRRQGWGLGTANARGMPRGHGTQCTRLHAMADVSHGRSARAGHVQAYRHMNQLVVTIESGRPHASR